MNIEYYFDIHGTYELKDGLYNVTGDVELIKKVEKLPVKFGKVTGSFDCDRNNLKSLDGSPISVGFNFYCYANNLTSLEGSPKRVGGDFYCSSNNLTNIEGFPKWVGGDIFCSNNNLTSLEGSPISIGGNFYCDNSLKRTKEYRQYLIMKKLRE
jgi:hypothetical protein